MNNDIEFVAELLNEAGKLMRLSRVMREMQDIESADRLYGIGKGLGVLANVLGFLGNASKDLTRQQFMEQLSLQTNDTLAVRLVRDLMEGLTDEEALARVHATIAERPGHPP